MILMDVNVLVYAHREDVKDHSFYQNWLESVINGNSKFGYSELVLSGFITNCHSSKNLRITFNLRAILNVC